MLWTNSQTAPEQEYRGKVGKRRLGIYKMKEKSQAQNQNPTVYKRNSMIIFASNRVTAPKPRNPIPAVFSYGTGQDFNRSPFFHLTSFLITF